MRQIANNVMLYYMLIPLQGTLNCMWTAPSEIPPTLYSSVPPWTTTN